MSQFWGGFEKKAVGLLGKALVGTRNIGKSIANRGLNMATTPGAGAVKSTVGKGMHSAGNFVTKHPGVALGAAGAAGAGAVGAATGAAMSGSNKTASVGGDITTEIGKDFEWPTS